MQRKTMFYQRFCQLNLWSVITDFSTEHNLTIVYRFFKYFFFIFLEHLDDSCFNITMPKWPIQKLTHRTTQKHVQHHDATYI